MSGFDINQLTISGHLTRDPELRKLNGGTSVCSIRIAHRGWRDDEHGLEPLRGHSRTAPGARKAQAWQAALGCRNEPRWRRPDIP